MPPKVVVVCIVMTRIHKKQTRDNQKSDPRLLKRRLLLAAFIVIALAVSGGTILLIANAFQGQVSPGIQTGVGADGFRAFVEEKSDMNVKDLVSRDQVIAALGTYATSVNPAEVSKVFNMNGDRGQTLTFKFIRKDGVRSNINIDKRTYTSKSKLEADGVYKSSLEYGTVNGRTVYVKRAQTIGGLREYHAVVVDDTTVYRLVLAQPVKNIKIKEVDSINILKNLFVGAKI